MILPHSEDSIRHNTMRLSNRMIPSTPGDSVPGSSDRSSSSSIFPVFEGDLSEDADVDGILPPLSDSPPGSSHSSINIAQLPAPASPSFPSENAAINTLRGGRHTMHPFQPSEFLRTRRRAQEDGPVEEYDQDTTDTPTSSSSSNSTPKARVSQLPGSAPPTPRVMPPRIQTQQRVSHRENGSDINESAPMLRRQDNRRSSYESFAPQFGRPHTRNGNGHGQHIAVQPKRTQSIINNVALRIRQAAKQESVQHALVIAFQSLPAVLLGSLLNILDGVSCACCVFKLLGYGCNNPFALHRRYDHLPLNWGICGPGPNGCIHVLRLVSFYIYYHPLHKLYRSFTFI